jgi:WD40 repeat protein
MRCGVDEPVSGQATPRKQPQTQQTSSPTKDNAAHTAEEEELALGRALEPLDVKISIATKHTLTIPHRVPANTDSVGKRQLKSLPCFTCLVHIPASDWYPQGQHDLIVAGQANGNVIQWKVNKDSSHHGMGGSSLSNANGTSTNSAFTLIGAHKGNVTCISYCSAVKLLVTGSSDCSIKLWDVTAVDPSTSRCIQTLVAHDSTVTAVAVHCNLIISGSIDKTLKVWRFEEGRDGLRFPWSAAKQVFIFESWVTTIWASPKKIAETSQGEVFVGDASGAVTVLRSVVLHDEHAESVVATHVELLRHSKPAKMTTSTVVTDTEEKRQTFTKLLPIPNLNLLISLSFDNCATVSDIVGFNPLVKIPHPNPMKRFIDVTWNMVHEEIILVDVDGIVFVWDTKSNRMKCQQGIGHNAAALSSAGKGITWLAERDSIIGFTVQRTSTVAEHKGHSGRILSVSLPFVATSNEEQHVVKPITSDYLEFFLATASVDNTICLWSSSMVLLKQFKEKYSEISAFLTLTTQNQGWLVSGHDNGSLKFWSLSKDKTFRFAAHDNTISGVYEGFHRLNRGQYERWNHFFSISYDGCLAIWEPPMEGNKAKCEGRIRVSHSELVSAAYDGLNKCYIVGCNTGEISLWSVDELKPLRQLTHSAPIPSSMGSLRSTPSHGTPAHTEAVTCIALDANYAFSGGEDSMIYLWNTVNGSLIKSLSYPTEQEMGDVQALIVLPESGDVLAATRTGYILLLSQDTGLATKSYNLGKEVSAMCYNRSNSEVVAGLEDGTILRIHMSMLQAIEIPADRRNGSRFTKAVAPFSNPEEIPEELEAEGSP